MLAADAYRFLAEEVWHGQTVVTSLGTTANEWWRITGDDGVFYMNSSMGLAAPFGLGLALSAPSLGIWVLDSDGSLAMNLGTLLTEGEYGPPNLVHFVLANGCYQAIGGHRLVNAGRTDWAALARAAGIGCVRHAGSLGELRQLAGPLAESGAFTFVVLEVDGVPGERKPLHIPFEGPEMKYRFGRGLEARHGLQVFGEYGY